MKTCLFLMIAFFGSYAAIGQWSLGVDAKVYDPVGEFNTNVEGIAAGLSFRGIRNSTSGRLSYGGEIGVAMYSNDDYTVELPSGNEIGVNEEDCFWTLHGMVQYSLFQNDAIRIYGEGRLGVTTFFSSTTSLIETTEFEDEFEFHGTAFNMGLGGGLTLNFGQVFTGERNPFNLDLGVAVHSGSDASYRDMDAVDTPTSLTDANFRSLTHYVGYRFGLLFDF